MMKLLMSALSRRPLFLFLMTLALVFIGESGIMWFLQRLDIPSPLAEGILDSALLTVILFPVVYFLMFRPLKHYQESLTRKEAEQKFNLLALVKAIILSDDFESALRITVKTLSETIGWDYGEAWVPTRDNKTLRCLSIHCGSDLKISKFRQVTEATDFRFDTGLPGRVWASRRYEWLPDISAVPDTIFLRNQAAREAGLKACFGIPIINEEKVLAVLVFCASESLPEDKWLVEMVSNVALQLGSLFHRKQMAEEKQMIQQQLYQAQKMESIGTLAGGIAHDFNNMLGAIRGFAELSLMDTDKANPVYEYLKHIVTSTDRAGILTRQLLLFSRKSNVELQPVNLNEAINNMLKMLTRLIGENIRIETKLDSDAAAIKADAGNIEQVLLNLVVNARDAIHTSATTEGSPVGMPTGGQITIQTENVAVDEKYYQLNRESHCGDFVCLTVADTGAGMSRETMAHIFEPFYTTKPQGKGTGLGLSVVYGIVKKHNGWTQVYSEPGQGTVFKIYLPATTEGSPVGKSDTRIIPPEQLKGRAERILVVEDDDGIRNLLINTMSKMNYQVFSAASGAEARTLFEQEKGDFRLILSDVVLPDTNGVDLTDELVKLKPGIPVLLSSGYASKGASGDVIRDRRLPFIQKPYNLNVLLKTVREMLEKQQ